MSALKSKDLAYQGDIFNKLMYNSMKYLIFIFIILLCSCTTNTVREEQHLISLYSEATYIDTLRIDLDSGNQAVAIIEAYWNPTEDFSVTTNKVSNTVTFANSLSLNYFYSIEKGLDKGDELEAIYRTEKFIMYKPYLRELTRRKDMIEKNFTKDMMAQNYKVKIIY